MMQGKTVGDTFIVLDSFALPVEGTETRVNAASEANEYMVAFVEASRDARPATPAPPRSPPPPASLRPASACQCLRHSVGTVLHRAQPEA